MPKSHPLKSAQMEDPLDSKEVRLQWPAHSHGSELSRLSRELFGSGSMTDVTLTCRGGAAFHAHKIVLAAASAYFRSFFEEVEGNITQHQAELNKNEQYVTKKNSGDDWWKSFRSYTELLAVHRLY